MLSKTFVFSLLFCFFICGMQAQDSAIIQGFVSDSLGQPLPDANLIARPFKKEAPLKFAITNSQGQYRLALDSSLKYTIQISYIGYKPVFKVIQPHTESAVLNFKLFPNHTALGQIIIEETYTPVEIKKDTIVYHVKAFTTGNERKMKDVLAKLPGVRVEDDGTISVRGKTVTELLVEDRSFFGGSSKLAVNNIPADAIASIEVIDDYHNVSFLKSITRSDQVAMNVKLNPGKKEFIFGDLEAGLGNDAFYQAHAGLFYYSPQLNLSYIGDLNNTGKSVMTLQDLMRFQGGVSQFINEHTQLSSLRAYTEDNRDMAASRTQFSALNFGAQLTPKLYLSGFGLLSKHRNRHQTISRLTYLNGSENTIEHNRQNQLAKSQLYAFNLKLDYDKSTTEKWYYNIHLQPTRQRNASDLQSKTLQRLATFDTDTKAKNIALKHYLEWHKSYDSEHKTSAVLNHFYTDKTIDQAWQTSTPFLVGLLPLAETDHYKLSQFNRYRNNTLKGIFKYYWVINSTNQLHFSLGDNYTSSQLAIVTQQELSKDDNLNFIGAGFGADIVRHSNDLFFGADYTFKWGKLTSIASVFAHFYDANTSQGNSQFSQTYFYVKPKWKSTYHFDDSEELELSYSFSNKQPSIYQLNANYRISAYNRIYRGSPRLKNARYHVASLFYRNFNPFNGLNLFTYLTFNKHVTPFTNNVRFQNTTQIFTAIRSHSPETTWLFNSTVQKEISQFRLGFQTFLSWFDFNQYIDNTISNHAINAQRFKLSLETDNPKWPEVKISYSLGFRQYNGLTNAKFQLHQFEASLQYNFWKAFTVKSEFSYLENKNITRHHTKTYPLLKLALDYHRDASPWGFSLSAENLLNHTSTTTYSLSEYMISQQTQYILPRFILLSVRYKL